jgi:hypothetical protein
MPEAVAWRFPVTSTVILETASLLRIDLHKIEHTLMRSLWRKGETVILSSTISIHIQYNLANSKLYNKFCDISNFSLNLRHKAEKIHTKFTWLL